MKRRLRSLGAVIGSALFLAAPGAGAKEPVGVTPEFFNQAIRPLTERYCFECHSTAEHEGDLDLERFTSMELVKRHPEILEQVVEVLRDEQMPPADAREQPTKAERIQLREWAEAVLGIVAQERAGDPGPVLLRRLSNAEYAYTVRDLTGVSSLDPVKEFPEDGAAGEGFSNTGQALVMSPALLEKYLGAANGIASHAVLLPDGLSFSPKSTRLDWTNELLDEIREFYRRFAELPAEKSIFESVRTEISAIAGPEENGRLPLKRYLSALFECRDGLRAGTMSMPEVARKFQLSPKYLGTVWRLLEGGPPSPLLDRLRTRWRAAGPGTIDGLAGEIAAWQGVMWKFGKVGSLDDAGNPRVWMEPRLPVVEAQELRVPLPAPAAGNELILHLAAGTAGEVDPGREVEFQQPRLIRPGRPTVLLRDVRAHVRALESKRERMLAATAKYLAAAAEVGAAKHDVDLPALARRHGLEEDAFKVWLDYLGIDGRADARLDLFTEQLTRMTGWDFVQGWGSIDSPGVVANSTPDQRVLIPGVILPRTVMLHPSLTECAAVGWRSPVKARINIDASVTHSAFGRGVNWSLELRRGRFRTRLATGQAAMVGEPTEFDVPGVTVGPLQNVEVEPGDLISLVIGARDGDSAASHTMIRLELTTVGDRPEQWSLSREVSPHILAGNPQADGAGRDGVWNFYREPVRGTEWLAPIPAGSLLSQWLAAAGEEEKRRLADLIERQLTSPPSSARGPDAAVREYLTSLGGPFFAGLPPGAATEPDSSAQGRVAWGLETEKFGPAPGGPPLDAASLALAAPAVIEVRLPADLFAGGELVTTARLIGAADGLAGAVQAQVALSPPQGLSAVLPGHPILASPGSTAWNRWVASCEDFRRTFPAALCYSKLTPTDEVITLEVFHRDDGPFVDLMLDDEQKARLDRLWDELHYVSQDVFTLRDNCEERLKQEEDAKKVPIPRWPRRDWEARLAKAGPPQDIARITQAVHRRAAAFGARLEATQVRHLDAVLDLADQAYRRPLSEQEKIRLRATYEELRQLEQPHDAAIRLLVARVLTSPDFLYRVETPAPGTGPVPVSATELASRLSYFLWSSAPDAALRAAAAAGKLQEPAELRTQIRRLLADPRVRRLATEFGCQWLRIRNFDRSSDKSARAFPGFADLRGAMYEESILFLTDLFQHNRPVLNLLEADYAFLNEALAAHYGIPGVSGPEWRRVEGVKGYSRGGILAQATVLARQSAASRTSPILRGSWIAEVILGSKLPKPPANVPQLPEDEAVETMTIRQLTEKHVSDPRCAGCHLLFDAYGFALEGFDAIGRFRTRDLGNRPIETQARLGNGAEFTGFEGLRDYLVNERRDEFLRQFCRKLLGYALGRAVGISDAVLLNRMQAGLANDGYRVEAAIEAIVFSPQFREIRGRDYVEQ